MHAAHEAWFLTDLQISRYVSVAHWIQAHVIFMIIANLTLHLSKGLQAICAGHELATLTIPRAAEGTKCTLPTWHELRKVWRAGAGTDQGHQLRELLRLLACPREYPRAYKRPKPDSFIAVDTAAEHCANAGLRTWPR